MKKGIFFSITLLYCFSLFSKPLHPLKKASLYDHLVEVNKEWLKIADNERLCKEVFFANDQQRIQKHLQLVEEYLRQHPSQNFSKKQLKNRNTALNILKAYYSAGVFPQNTFHNTRQPYFQDVYGTTCAVGYLALQTGKKTLVEQISQEMNYAYISALKNQYPALLDWAVEYGFTTDELAWIQPGYQPLPQSWFPIGNGGGFEGKINTMKAVNDDMLYFAGEFSEIDGVSANNIIGWDGTEWHPLGNGVTGIIYDIDVSGDHLYIAGDFYVNDHPEIINVAKWDNGEWEGYDLANMSGEVYTILNAAYLYIGGDFELEDSEGNTIRNLAHINPSTNVVGNHENALSVDGIVYDLDHNGGNLLVAGDFTETAYYSSDSDITHLETHHLAYWSNTERNWILGFNQEIDFLNAVLINYGYIYTGGHQEDNYATGAGIYNAGLWEYVPFYKIDPDQANMVHGIVHHNEVVVFYGNINYEPIIGTYSKGIYVYSPTYYNLGAVFDAPVTAAESFQDQLYFAGDFSSVNGLNFSGLVSSPFSPLTSNEAIFGEKQFDVSFLNGQVEVEYQDLSEATDFMIYNLNGQLIHAENILPGSGEKVISTQNWAAGMYVYQISGKGTRESGKVVVF